AGPCRFFAEREVKQGPRAFLPRGETRKDLVQFVALIDQNRRRAEGFPAIRCRTDILAAIAHDAAVSIKQSWPGKFLQFGSAEDLLLFEIHRLQDSRLVLLQRQIDRGHKEMDMFRTWEVRNEDENRTQGTPPKKMIQTFNNARIHTGKNSGHERAHGMKKIGAFAAQLSCLEHEAAANMKKNEACDDRGSPQNPRTNLGLHRHIG